MPIYYKNQKQEIFQLKGDWESHTHWPHYKNSRLNDDTEVQVIDITKW